MCVEADMSSSWISDRWPVLDPTPQDRPQASPLEREKTDDARRHRAYHPSAARTRVTPVLEEIDDVASINGQAPRASMLFYADGRAGENRHSARANGRRQVERRSRAVSGLDVRPARGRIRYRCADITQ